MIWVDTSVWVDHFKNRNEYLVRLLVSDSALIHPLIIADLACGRRAENPNPEQPPPITVL
jgi:predicted nucleic acid-binding protein